MHVYRWDSTCSRNPAGDKWFWYARICVETLFYYLAILQIGVGVYLVWHGLRWVGYVRRRMRGDPGFNAPRAAVLCPRKIP